MTSFIWLLIETLKCVIMWFDMQLYRGWYRNRVLHVILNGERLSYNQTIENNIEICIFVICDPHKTAC